MGYRVGGLEWGIGGWGIGRGEERYRGRMGHLGGLGHILANTDLQKCFHNNLSKVMFVWDLASFKNPGT